MGQGIIFNMRVYPGKYLPEPYSGLQLTGVGAMEWKYPASKTYVRGQSGGVKYGDTGSLNNSIGSGYVRFGEYGNSWAGD